MNVQLKSLNTDNDDNLIFLFELAIISELFKKKFTSFLGSLSS